MVSIFFRHFFLFINIIDTELLHLNKLLACLSLLIHSFKFDCSKPSKIAEKIKDDYRIIRPIGYLVQTRSDLFVVRI